MHAQPQNNTAIQSVNEEMWCETKPADKRRMKHTQITDKSSDIISGILALFYSTSALTHATFTQALFSTTLLLTFTTPSCSVMKSLESNLGFSILPKDI